MNQSRSHNSYYSSPLPSSPSPKRRKTGRRIVFILVLLTAASIYHFWGTLELSFSSHSNSKASAAERPVLSSQQAFQIAAQINAVISANPNMEIGVSIQDLNSGQRYHFGISDPFIAASTAKVLTAALFLHEVELGQQSLSEQVGGYSAQYELQQMIEVSDNTAWENLNDLLTHPALKAYGTSIGLQNYDPDDNTLTVDDISVLLAKLYKEQLLNSDHTQLLLSYMKDADYSSYIPASVPAGVTVYHKAGWLSDRVHDGAIIDNGKHPYVLVIFTKTADGSDYPADQGHQIFADITKATTKAFL